MRYIVLLLSLFLFLFPTAIHAQEVSLALSPLEHTIIARPGTKLSMPFTLRNYGDATLVNVQFVRLSVADSLGNYTLLPLDDKSIPEPQLSLNGTQNNPFLLLADEEYSDKAIIEIPAETKEQDYYYALLSSTENSQGFETSSSIKLHGGVAAPIFITVSKNGTKDNKLGRPQVELKHAFDAISHQFLDTKNPISGSIDIENTGGNITNVNGSILLSRSFGFLPFKGYTSSIPSLTILAHSRKSLRLPDIQQLPTGYYTLTAMVTNGVVTQSTSTTFLLFPFTLMSYFLLIVLVCIAGFFIYKRYTNT